MLKWFGHEVVWRGAEGIVLLQVFFRLTKGMEQWRRGGAVEEGKAVEEGGAGEEGGEWVKDGLSVSNPTYYGELWESHTQISPGPGGGHGPVHHNKFTIISSPPPIKLRVSKLHLRN